MHFDDAITSISMADTVEVKPQGTHTNIPRRDLFFLIRLNMRIAAMCPLPLKDYLPRFLGFVAVLVNVTCELLLYFVTIHIAMLYACTLYLFYQEGSLEFLVNCLIQLIIYFWTIAMKIYFRRVSPTLLRDLMESINSEYRTRSAPGLTYVSMDETFKLSQKWIKIYVYCCFSGTIFWLILPIAYGDRSLPLSCWYPFDYKEPKVYEAMYFLQLLGQLQVAASFSTSSGFHMVLAILISGQYDVLHCSLKNILATTYIRLGAQRSDLLELERQQQISNAEQNQYYCSKEHTDDYVHLPQLRQQLLQQQRGEELNERPQNFREAFKASLKDCVQHHRCILRFLAKMESFYNFIWLVKSGEVVLLMCLVAFVSVKSTTANSSFMKILSLAQYLVLVIWELFIICYFGEMIYQNSRRCGEAILRSPWYLHMREIKADFLFFLMNSQRAFKLSAGKMYSLDINRFRAIMTTAFSFFTILQKMDQRK